MILRKFSVRHGRAALQTSWFQKFESIRCFATRIDTRPATEEPVPIEEKRLSLPSNPDKKVWSNTNEYFRKRKNLRASESIGTAIRGQFYDPRDFENEPPSVEEITLPLLLASQSHLGHATGLWNPHNSSYITGVRDGIHIISLEVTAAYLRRACKVVREVAKRGGLILFVGTRDRQEDIVVRAARLTGGYHIFDRWVPGSLTNGQQILGHCRMQIVDPMDKEIKALRPYLREQPVSRPDLVVCLNPLENEVCLHECGLYNVPTIGVIDTDADASWVTYPIPANDDSLRCITLLAGAMGKAGQAGQQERLELAKRGELTYRPVDMKNAKMYSGAEETEESSEEVGTANS